MRLFQCQYCGHLLYFGNSRCERCGRPLGYLPELAQLSTLEPDGTDVWVPLASPERPGRWCANARWSACNWLVQADSADAL